MYRSKNGYAIYSWYASLVRIISEDRYYIQLHLKPTKRIITIYKGKERPQFRNLGLISLLLIPYALIFIPVFVVALIMYAAGSIVFCTGKVFKALGFLLLMAPHSAKKEIQDFFDIWYPDPRDIL